MDILRKNYDIGVIIGRFQINRLHSEHKALIDSVIERHDKVIIFLGVPKSMGTRRNPLDFSSREVMIREEYGDNISAILPLRDMKTDANWSKQVDGKIREVFQSGSVVLYGSRDSFIPHYQGRFDTQELEATKKISGSELRDEIKNKVERSAEFRSGAIYTAYNQFPIVHPTVDIAIVKEKTQEILLDGKPNEDVRIIKEEIQEVLLGRKPNEYKYRFVGGFVDVEDENYEVAAKREVMEETGLEVGDLQYLGSARVDDWRYRADRDRGITTTFFKAKYIFGSATAKDDIEEVKWFKLDELNEYNLVPEHVKLLELLTKNNITLKYFNNEKAK